jgi:hypothetical protein
LQADIKPDEIPLAPADHARYDPRLSHLPRRAPISNNGGRDIPNRTQAGSKEHTAQRLATIAEEASW